MKFSIISKRYIMFAISLLVIGMKVEDVIGKLKGLPCEGRETSCPDQLARALEQWKIGQ